MNNWNYFVFTSNTNIFWLWPLISLLFVLVWSLYFALIKQILLFTYVLLCFCYFTSNDILINIFNRRYRFWAYRRTFKIIIQIKSFDTLIAFIVRVHFNAVLRNELKIQEIFLYIISFIALVCYVINYWQMLTSTGITLIILQVNFVLTFLNIII